jgi:two-component system LytT family response regulator
MTITTYIIDDEYHAVEVLTDYIGKTPGLTLTGSSTDPLQALEAITTMQAPLLTFLDVDMPGLSGIELGKLISGSTKVIFTTSYREFGPEAFELGAADYLLKPISYERFLKCVQKIRTELSSKDDQHVKEPFSFFVKTDIKGKLVRIMANDIIYISSDQNYLHIHLSHEKIKAYLTMSELLEQLPAAQFCRTHRSYIVNLNCVKGVEPGQIRLSNQVVIDLGRTYRDELMQRLNSTLIISHRDRNA